MNETASASGMTVNFELKDMTLAKLGDMRETLAALNVAAPKTFEDDPFLAAHMKRAAVILLEIEYRARRAYEDILHFATVPGDPEPPAADKPKRVKHAFDAAGACTLEHVLGVPCAEKRKRAPRAVAAAGSGEGSST